MPCKYIGFHLKTFYFVLIQTTHMPLCTGAVLAAYSSDDGVVTTVVFAV